jgi:hypothetical protein
MADQTVMEKRVAQWRAITARLKEMDEAHEKQRQPLLDIKALLEGLFEKFLTDSGQSSAVFSTGTVHWNRRTTASLADPQAFMDFVTQNGLFQLLDRKANATAVRDYAEEKGDLPPGVTLNTARTVGVRKPGDKAAKD